MTHRTNRCGWTAGI